MKQLLYLFSFYFLSLAVFPCGDDAGHSKAEEENCIVENHDDASQNEHAENCPPLCTCSCCGFHVLKIRNGLKIAKPVFDIEHIAASLHFYPQEIYRPVWQPPQLG